MTPEEEAQLIEKFKKLLSEIEYKEPLKNVYMTPAAWEMFYKELRRLGDEALKKS